MCRTLLISFLEMVNFKSHFHIVIYLLPTKYIFDKEQYLLVILKCTLNYLALYT